MLEDEEKQRNDRQRKKYEEKKHREQKNVVRLVVVLNLNDTVHLHRGVAWPLEMGG